MNSHYKNDPGSLGLLGVEVLVALIDDADSNIMPNLVERIATEESGSGLTRATIGLSHTSMYLLSDWRR
jgi:hypothetical protein